MPQGDVASPHKRHTLGGCKVLRSKLRAWCTNWSWTVAGSREAVVRLLVEKGVEADSKDKYRQTPLLWATGGPNGAVVQLL
jgi:hypothetical protein